MIDFEAVDRQLHRLEEKFGLVGAAGKNLAQSPRRPRRVEHSEPVVPAESGPVLHTGDAWLLDQTE